MGEHVRRLAVEGARIPVDFSTISYAISPGDRKALSVPEESDGTPRSVSVRVTELLIGELLAQRFPRPPQGSAKMPRHDGRYFAVWQEVLYTGSALSEVTWGSVIWLKKLAEDEEVAINPMMSQWREALIGWLETLQLPQPTSDDELA